jgi:hypothetical protein
VEVEVKLAKAKVFGSAFFNVTADEWGGSMGRPSRGAGLGYVHTVPKTTSVVTDYMYVLIVQLRIIDLFL